MSEAAPKNGEYQDGKLWFHRKASIVTIGLTNAAVEEVGTVEKLEMPDEEGDYGKGEVIVTIEGTNGRLEVTAPAAGVVSEINETIQEEPDRVSEDPLEEGWLVKIEIEDPSDLKEYV